MAKTYKRSRRRRQTKTRRMRGGAGIQPKPSMPKPSMPKPSMPKPSAPYPTNPNVGTTSAPPRKPTMPKPTGPAVCSPGYGAVRQMNGTIDCVPGSTQTPTLNSLSMNLPTIPVNRNEAERRNEMNRRTERKNQAYESLKNRLTSRTQENSVNTEGRTILRKLKEDKDLLTTVYLYNHRARHEEGEQIDYELGIQVLQEMLKENELPTTNESGRRLTEGELAKEARSLVYKKIRELDDSVVLKEDINNDLEILERIRLDTKGIENRQNDLALLVAQKLFSYTELYRGAGCPQTENQYVTVEFPNDFTYEGIDLGYRKEGLQHLRGVYEKFKDDKLQKQHETNKNTSQFLRFVKNAGKTARNTLTSFTGTKMRASRTDMINLLINLEKNSIVRLPLCEWRTYANRLEYDFKFPSFQALHGNQTPIEIKELILNSVLVGSARTAFILNWLAIGMMFPGGLELAARLMYSYTTGKEIKNSV